MALPAALQALFDRLQTYNSDAYNASTNPGGFARGGNQKPVDNFIKSVRDFTAFGKGISDLTSSASSDAIAAAQAASEAKAARDAAQTSATNAATSEGNALTYRNQAQAAAAGVSLPAITAANALQFLQVKPDGSGYRTVDIPPDPAILPITMTAPTSGATDVGAGGTYTFVARAFVGDTTGFYSNYGVPVASRFVNVYEPGGANPVKTFTASGGGPSLVANLQGSGLAVSHAYQFEFGYTDAQGNTVKSPKVSATTASQFKPSEGQAYQGGFLGFQNFGDGDLFDLVVAPKSTEANKQWYSTTSNLFEGMYSRVSGDRNTTRFAVAVPTNTTTFAAGYAATVTIGGAAAYLGAIDELRAISSKLKPSVAVEAAFKAGGVEAFVNGAWSSTELTSSNASATNMTTGSDASEAKTTSYPVRAIKRVSTFAPYPIGTAMEGGTLAAYFTDLSSGSPVTYMLIVADKATEVTRQWATTNALNGGSVQSRTNGFTPTDTVDWTSAYPAFLYCKDLVSGGKTDWYLGAIDEMLAIARMNSQLPSAQQLVVDQIWTSTETAASTAKALNADRTENDGTKGIARYVRPIRRALLPAT
ncbi:hypothetical protein ACP4J4_10440 [Aureimonas ureilytica]|uniref:hypothetical protein n=1 Tax=Aureimonas ureilytica TaxID=401562 RepID=UPI003CE828E9